MFTVISQVWCFGHDLWVYISSQKIFKCGCCKGVFIDTSQHFVIYANSAVFFCHSHASLLWYWWCQATSLDQHLPKFVMSNGPTCFAFSFSALNFLRSSGEHMWATGSKTTCLVDMKKRGGYRLYYRLYQRWFLSGMEIPVFGTQYFLMDRIWRKTKRSASMRFGLRCRRSLQLVRTCP